MEMSIIPNQIWGLPLAIKYPLNPIDYPAWISELFSLYRIQLGEYEFTALESRDRVDLTQIKHALAHLNASNHTYPIVFSPYLTFYQRKAMVERNIGFYRSEDNVFIPHLLRITPAPKEYSSPRPLSPFSQLLFIQLLSRNWLNKNNKGLASAMGKSPSSVTKYLKEIEAISPTLIERNHQNTDGIVWRSPGFSPQETLGEFLPYLRSPVAEERLVFTDPENLVTNGLAKWAGITALSKHSDLMDDAIPTIAVPEKTWKAIQENPSRYNVTIPSYQDEGNTRLQYWRYWSASGSRNCVDRISLYLSLKDEAESDPRIEAALNQLLAEVFDARNR